jgi:hypothetical protein
MFFYYTFLPEDYIIMLYMLRNLCVDCFVILYIVGFFRFIPNYILILISFAWFFDSFSLYFNGIGKKITDRNSYLKNFVKIYLKYSKPVESNSPILFFLDRLGVAVIFIIILIYYYYSHGAC